MLLSISNFDEHIFMRHLIGGFLALTILLVIATEVLLRIYVVPQDNFFAHIRLLEATQVSHAAFGDSHVARGFNPSGDMLNLAFPSQNIEQMDWTARHYFKSHKPEKIIIQADPHLFAPYRLNKGLNNYAQPAHDKATYLYIADPRFRPQLVALWARFISSGGKLSSAIKQTTNGALLSSGDFSKKPMRQRALAARKRIRLHSITAHPKLAAHKKLYSDLLFFLQEKGAEICLVTFPLSPDYITALNKVSTQEAIKRRQSILNFFSQEAERTQSRYIDSQKLIRENHLFRNEDHLNKAGAISYSLTLEQECFSE